MMDTVGIPMPPTPRRMATPPPQLSEHYEDSAFAPCKRSIKGCIHRAYMTKWTLLLVATQIITFIVWEVLYRGTIPIAMLCLTIPIFALNVSYWVVFVREHRLKTMQKISKAFLLAYYPVALMTFIPSVIIGSIVYGALLLTVRDPHSLLKGTGLGLPKFHTAIILILWAIIFTVLEETGKYLISQWHIQKIVQKQSMITQQHHHRHTEERTTPSQSISLEGHFHDEDDNHIEDQFTAPIPANPFQASERNEAPQFSSAYTRSLSPLRHHPEALYELPVDSLDPLESTVVGNTNATTHPTSNILGIFSAVENKAEHLALITGFITGSSVFSLMIINFGLHHLAECTYAVWTAAFLVAISAIPSFLTHYTTSLKLLLRAAQIGDFAQSSFLGILFTPIGLRTVFNFHIMACFFSLYSNKLYIVYPLYLFPTLLVTAFFLHYAFSLECQFPRTFLCNGTLISFEYVPVASTNIQQEYSLPNNDEIFLSRDMDVAHRTTIDHVTIPTQPYVNDDKTLHSQDETSPFQSAPSSPLSPAFKLKPKASFDHEETKSQRF